jgi:hypothetical protein
LLLVNCKEKILYKNSYTLLKNDDSIIIRLTPISNNRTNCLQYLVDDGTNYLAVLSRNNDAIEIYNLDEEELQNVIKINKEGPNSLSNVTGFVMRSLDSVIVVSSVPPDIGIYDKNGNQLKKINYSMDINGIKISSPDAGLGRKPLLIGDSVFIMPYINIYDPSNILSETSNENNYLNVCVNIITGRSLLSGIKLPDELVGQDVTGIHVWRELGFNNQFIYSFNLLNGLYLTSDHRTFEKRELETNYTLNIKSDLFKGRSLSFNAAMAYYFSFDEVLRIHYDSFRECYYIVVNKKIMDFENVSDFRVLGLYPSFYIIILDKYLNYLGDVFFPDNEYNCHMMFITPKGLHISEDHINNQTFSEDYMRFRLFKLGIIKN